MLACCHLAAFVAALASVSGAPLVLIIIGVIVSGACTVADALLRMPSSVQCFELEEDGSGRWRDRAGRLHTVRRTRASWVSAGLVVLGLQTGAWRTRWLVLLPDSAASDALRQLRVWLKWRPA
jgi:hypothetical protein